MDSGHFFFDPSASGNMLFRGNNNPVFRGRSTTMISMEDNVAKKRPFFTSPEEIFYDEEHYDEQLQEKKRRLTPEQVLSLEKSFEEENKLEPERKSELAQRLGLQPRQVAVWFQNRRARSKAKQLERDYDLLRASYDSLQSNYDSIVKENEKLKSEVNSLTEKLKANDGNVLGPKCDPIIQMSPQDGATVSAQQQWNKAEEMQSSGSGASGVVNEGNPQIVDTGDSYFDCIAPPCMAAIQSEDDDISDDGRSYFSTMYTMAADHQKHHHELEEEEGHALGWWVWS